MPDWRESIRKKLAGTALSSEQRESLIAELASHLEDLHAELLASGIGEPEASANCLEELNAVRQIAVAARRSRIWEDAMNQRSRTLWLPGLITLALASVLLMMMQMFTFSRPRIHWIDGGAVAMGYAWLVSLLPCGALGAYLSRRAGGSRWRSITASLFPSLVMLGLFSLGLPIGIFFEHNRYIIHHPWDFGLALLVWVVVPGAALLIGALPVLWKMRAGNRGNPKAPLSAA